MTARDAAWARCPLVSSPLQSCEIMLLLLAPGLSVHMALELPILDAGAQKYLRLQANLQAPRHATGNPCACLLALWLPC